MASNPPGRETLPPYFLDEHAFWGHPAGVDLAAGKDQTVSVSLPFATAPTPRKYRKKPVIVEAITFEELVDYGKASGANIVNGMPWSFEYKGQPITHENDDCYIIPT